MKFKWVILLAALSTATVGSGCQRVMKADEPTNATPTTSAAKVVSENSSRLMALPDVVGVYEGLMPDGKTHCIVVMLSKNNPQTVKQLPEKLGSYPVRVEVTGEIKPMSK